jgi:hypothetical protein
MSIQSSRTLPKPVKEWAGRGLEFTDGGLGIGDRFDWSVVAKSSLPGPGAYNCSEYGDVAKWVPESCVPTKQADARFTSAETHKMGARRDMQKKADRQRPGPGTYELKGFAEEILQKCNRRPRKQTDPAPNETVAENPALAAA